jgi:dTDP-4-dehydrorhamnose 3,5-epimerase-like enzyme
MKSKEKTDINQEKVMKIKPVYEDERGKIIDIVDGDEFVHAGIVTFKPGAIRGNHYHKQTEQVNYILKGKIRYFSRDLSKENTKVKEDILEAGDMIIDPPLGWHSQEAIEESEMLFFTKKKRGKGGYEDDVFRIPREEIDNFKTPV